MRDEYEIEKLNPRKNPYSNSDVSYALGTSPCAFPNARNEVVEITDDVTDLRTNLRTNREGCV
jgi:hypothetical protein